VSIFYSKVAKMLTK